MDENLEVPERQTSQSVRLAFRYEQRDYVRALRLYYAERLHVKLDIAIGVACLAAGFFLKLRGTLELFGVVLLVLGTAMLTLITLAFTVIPVLWFRRDPRMHDEFSLVFSMEGIHYRTSKIDSRLQWGVYSRAVIGAHSYLLYHGRRAFTVIPARVFENAQQRAHFEELITVHIPKISRH